MYLLVHETRKMGKTVAFCLHLQLPRRLLKSRDHLIDLRGLRILEQLLPILQEAKWKTTSANFQILLLKEFLQSAGARITLKVSNEFCCALRNVSLCGSSLGIFSESYNTKQVILDRGSWLYPLRSVLHLGALVLAVCCTIVCFPSSSRLTKLLRV